jgi:GGDEF domain-containing protein
VFHINNSQEKLTISIGIASRPEHGASFDEILQGANDAKQETKKTKNTVKLFQSDSSDSSLLLLIDENI